MCSSDLASLKTASGWIRCNDTKITFSDEKEIKSLLSDFCLYHKVKVVDRINPPLKRIFNEYDFPPPGTTERKKVIYDDQNSAASTKNNRTVSLVGTDKNVDSFGASGTL